MLMDGTFHPGLVEGTAWSVPEIWGGIECTVNRIRDGYRDRRNIGVAARPRGEKRGPKRC